MNEQNMNEQKMTDAFLSEEGGIFICYRSGMTVYEEQMAEKRYVTAGWNGAGYPLNVLDGRPTRQKPGDFTAPQAFDVQANGISLTDSWHFESFEKREETLENGTPVLHCTVRLKSDVLPLAVQVHTLLDGTAVLERYLVLENPGESPLNINKIGVMGGGLEVLKQYSRFMPTREPQKAYSLGYFDYSQWAYEGAFGWHDLCTEITTVCGRHRRHRHRHPAFFLRNNLLGTVFAAQLAYSGGYAFEFDLSVENNEEKLSLSYSIEMDEEAPILILAPGGSYRTPEVHMGMMNGDLDGIVNEMHSHIRKSVMTLPGATLNVPGGLIEAGMGAERVMNMTAVKHFADTAAMVGAEALIIDAGWYCPPGKEGEWFDRAGDWAYDRELYPNGIGEIRDYIHGKGLLFGMWLDAERIGKSSEMFALHPEWIAKLYHGKVTSLIDMTNPEACAWAERQVEHLIRDYKIDIFRLDYNITSAMMNYRAADGSSGYARYCEAVYAMYERLRRKYPHVVFENCAGGGGRTDLGLVKYFTHTWVTDWQVAPRSAAITNGMTLVLPPETVDRLVSGMESHTRSSLAFMTRHTLFGRPTVNDFNPIGNRFNREQIEFVRHSYEIYKEYVRPYACGGRIYHHTAECTGDQPQGVLVMERSDADRRVGILGAFTLADTAPDEIKVYPRGIDLSKTYEVLFDNRREKVVLGGYSMVNDGIRVSLRNSLSSELIAYRAVE